MILVDLNGLEAKIDNGTWLTTDVETQRFLRGDEEFFQEFDNIGSDPDPDLTSARRMVRNFGGRIISTERHVQPRADRGTIY